MKNLQVAVYPSRKGLVLASSLEEAFRLANEFQDGKRQSRWFKKGKQSLCIIDYDIERERVADWKKVTHILPPKHYFLVI